MELMEELEEKLINLIRERRIGKLADLREYHKALSELNTEVLETIFTDTMQQRSFPKKPKRGYAEKMGLILANYPNAYTPWDPEQEKQLAELYSSGKTIAEISKIMQRQKGGILSRLKKISIIKK